MNNQQSTGKVTLAGAGPGDAELITVKLQRRLADAEVIIIDRLVNPLIVEEHASAAALVIQAGKQGYNEASLSQEEVTALIIEHALKGKRVLRLKGGDTAFFSNVLDELQALQQHSISFEIIPGITAASGASAYTGIPLTARGYSQSVQFLTFNPNSYYSSEKWKSIASSNDTLVFYMAAKNITDLAELLLRFSRKSLTPLAVIEQATTANQQIHISTLKDCITNFAGRQFSSPSLIIIGEVVNLQQDFNWFAANSTGSVFNELVTV
ncbi:uroporphyrinogen-III C-methyltransferase [Chitinophagaceae bacterium IBVUCB2]|nr:uroporphyrinogen-III C-methyltransferase [Chitinophagaceae bacterium IBVUCB2]